MSLIKSNGGGLGGSGSPGGALGSFYGHTIDQSLRVNGSNKSLSRTVGSSVTNRKKFTISGWVKLAFPTGLTSTASAHMWAGYGKNGGNYGQLGFYNDQFYYFAYPVGTCYLVSTQLFRDRSAWYHIVFSVDTTQSTAADRNKVYINGSQITSFSTQTNYSLNHDTDYNVADSATNHFVGSSGNTGGSPYQWFEGYIAEFHFVDGTTLDPSSFGETKDGVWIAKEYSGSHGDNGYYLPFDDTSAIGDDESANTNDFTSNNLAAHDVLPDSPTKNFAVMNSLTIGDGRVASGVTQSEGNLKVATSGFSTSVLGGTLSTIAIPKDKKIYVEVCEINQDANLWGAGVVIDNHVQNSTQLVGNGSIAYYNRSIYRNGVENDYGSGGGALGGLGVSKLSAGDVLGIAVDGSTGKVWFHRNGTYFGEPQGHQNGAGTTGNPSAGTNEIGTITNTYSINPSGEIFIFVTGNTSVDDLFVNFGQDSTFAGNKSAGSETDANGDGKFLYAVPTDYVCLHSGNMKDLTIGPAQSSQADDNFNTVLYTGDGDNDVTATNTFAADWVWLKKRSATGNSYLQDIVRGFGASKSLSANTNGNEGYNGGAPSSHNIVTTDSSIRFVSSDFASDTKTFVAWTWKAGGSASTISADSISSGVPANASSVSVNTDAGFSIISYTGTGSTTTFGHGLGVQPEAMFIKNRDASRGWFLLTKAFQTKYFSLEGTGSGQTGYYLSGNTFDDRMTATLMTVDGSTTETNTNGEKYICYAFAGVEGYSKFGSFSGNSSANGTFVYLGFRPAYVILKRDSNGVDWSYFDSKRLGYNVDNNNLRASAAAGPVEQTDNDIDFLSNGFKCRRNFANNQGTVLFLAWAEAPFKFSNAR